MTPPRSIRGVRWIGPGLLVAGIAGLAASFLDPRTTPSSFEFGLLYTVTRHNQALPLLAAGFALAGLPRRLCIISVAIFALGIASGSFISDWMGTAVAKNVWLASYVLLIDPISCVVAGVALAAPRKLANLLTPPAVLIIGASLGLVVDLGEPDFSRLAFAAGAVLAGLWLVIAPLLTWRSFERPWLAIAARIFGSWLIAIGAMLAAAQLIPPRLSPEEAGFEDPQPQPIEAPAAAPEPMENTE